MKMNASTVVAPGTVDEDGFRKSSWSVHNPASRFCVTVKMEGNSVLVRDTKDPAKATVTMNGMHSSRA